MFQKYLNLRVIALGILVFVLLHISVSLLPAQKEVEADLNKIMSALNKSNTQYKKSLNYLNKGKIEEAEARLRRCLSLCSKHDRASYLFSQILFNRSEFEESLAYIESAEQSHVFLFKANITLKQEALPRMLRQIDKWNQELWSLPDNCIGENKWVDLTNAIEATQDKIEEIQNELSEIDTDRNPVPYEYSLHHGNVLMKLGKYQEAKKQYLRVAKDNPKNSDAYHNLLRVLYFLNQYEDALVHLNKAEESGIDIMPQLSDAIRKAYNAYGPSENDYPGGIKKFVVMIPQENNSILVNTYIVHDPETRDAVIIDPGEVDERIESFIAERGLNVRMVLNTHGHFDHTGANKYYSDLYHTQIAAHRFDSSYYGGTNAPNKPHIWLGQSEDIQAGSLKIRSIHTPGHTPGSTCFLMNQCLFSGDTLFKETIARATGDREYDKIVVTNKIIAIVKGKLLNLADDTRVFPGHMRSTFIAHEKANNPYLNKELALLKLKSSYGKDSSIIDIQESNSDELYDIRFCFSNREGLESFRKSYGDEILGFKLKLDVK